MRQARFETPAPPAGWDQHGVHLVRIVDPLGDAIAWFAPEAGAACVGFAVRQQSHQQSRWVQIFDAAGPDDTLAVAGCSVLTRFRACSAAVGTRPDWDRTGHQEWALVERDPTAAVFETLVRDDEEREAGFTLRFSLTAWLENTSLFLMLSAANEGLRAVSIGVGIRPTFATETIKGGFSTLPQEIDDYRGDRTFQVGQIESSIVALTLDKGFLNLAWHVHPNQKTVSAEALGYHLQDDLIMLHEGDRTELTATVQVDQSQAQV